AMLPGLAELLLKRLNENVTITAAMTITTSATISFVEFLPIHDKRSRAVGSVVGSGCGPVAWLSPIVDVVHPSTFRVGRPATSPGSGDPSSRPARSRPPGLGLP